MPLVVPVTSVPEPEIPVPRPHQEDALVALASKRQRDWQKGLVVLATGMGKTYLAAFDAAQTNANRALFVAHREEILLQAEDSFLAILPKKRPRHEEWDKQMAELDKTRDGHKAIRSKLSKKTNSLECSDTIR